MAFPRDMKVCKECGRPEKTLLEELLSPWPSMLFSPPSSMLRWPENSVCYDNNNFKANFDVQHFKPEEISVKILPKANAVTVEAKHEEKPDAHGHIYRHFVRRYTLPSNCDIQKLQSRLSNDGVLSICAPTVGGCNEATSIPITSTGQPAGYCNTPIPITSTRRSCNGLTQ